MLPVVAVPGTVTTIPVEFQVVEVAVTPLNVTNPEEPRFEPAIVTVVPTAPLNGEILLITGALPPEILNSCPAVPDPAAEVTVTVTLLLKPAGTIA